MALPILTSLSTSMATWFTPTYLFCFLNLIIATIFIASNFKSHSHNHHQYEHHQQNPQLARAPSLLERVKSIDFSLYRSETPDSVYTQGSGPTQLQRAPSLLQRVKSFSLYNEEQPDPNPVHTQYPGPSLLERVKSFSLYNSDKPNPDSEPDPGYTQYAGPSLLERVKSFSLYKEDQPDQDLEPDQVLEPDLDSEHEPPRLVRYPTLLQRVKSIKRSLYSSEQPDPDHHVTRSKSDKSGEAPARVPAKMKKSASEKNVGPSSRSAEEEEEENEDEVDRRRPETTRERKTAVFGEDEEVDAKADDFINRFKQQLKLQRLDSLIRYKETLNRRVGK